MGYKVVQTALGASVAHSGSFTIAYPAGTAQADFTGGNALAAGYVSVNNNNEYRESDSKISITYGASSITITNTSNETWPAGASVVIGLAFASQVDTFVQVGPVANIDGDTTGTADGEVEALPTVDTVNTSDTYSDAALNAVIGEVNAMIAAQNDVNAELQTKINELLAALRTSGLLIT